MGVCDISADYMGSIEFTSRFTSIEEPFLVWDAINNSFKDKIDQADENCILFHSVDHLPAEMPKEASNWFGQNLVGFVKQVAMSDPKKSWEDQKNDLPIEIYNATLTCHGKLTPKYEYIAELREINEKIKAAQPGTTPLSEKKKSGLKRNMSLMTLTLEGHLFDTKGFNNVIDMCEQYKIQFRVINWDIGNYNDAPSKVAIQMMAKDKTNLNDCIDEIEKIAELCKLDLISGDKQSDALDGMFLESPIR